MASGLIFRIRSVLTTLHNRGVSSHALQNLPMKTRMLTFIMDNPILSDSQVSGSLDSPTKKTLSDLQNRLLLQLEVADPDFNERRMRTIPNTSKENPIIVGSDLERKIEKCLCFPDVHYIRNVLLYRNLPTRCQCGHWFKLVDLNTLEEHREKWWAQVKDQPENAKLLEKFTQSESELSQLFETGKNVTPKSPNADELLEKLATAWKNYKDAYIQIRQRMNPY